MNQTAKITIPYTPRACFRVFHASGAKRKMIIAHRRAGKTVADVNEMIKRSITENAQGDKNHYGAGEWAQYHYIHVTEKDALDTAWQYFDQYLHPFRQHFRVDARISDAVIDLIGGGLKIRYFFRGTKMGRGGYSDGAILDEFAFHPPDFWDSVFKYMLIDRGGWLVRTTTPTPNPSAYEMWQKAQDDPNHFTLNLRPEDTQVFSEETLREAKAEVSEEKWQQEMELDWMAGQTDLTYGRYLLAARNEQRIGKLPYLPSLPVFTAWDLGVRDLTSIWFFQLQGKTINIIDFLQGQGQGADYYVKAVKERGYHLGDYHLFPHDIRQREWGQDAAQSREKTVENFGLAVTRVVKTQSLSNSIEHVRKLFPTMYFDAEKCREGLYALDNYKLHDLTKEGKKHSHAADALRTMVDGLHLIQKNDSHVQYSEYQNPLEDLENQFDW